MTSLSADQAIAAACGIFADVAKALRRVGFQHCHYRIILPIPVSQPTVIELDSRELATANYTVLARSDLDNCAGFSIDHALLELIGLLRDTRARRDKEAGLYSKPKDSVTVVSYHHNGAVGHMTFTPVLTLPNPRSRQPIVECVARLVHERIASLLVANYVPESGASLTSREREVLRWTAEGKTAPEIGQILSVSTNTIAFHRKNIVAKLASSNKIQAAVKATALGILR
jgi:LuxR family transcriptional regulator, quorum-sensing system regulator SolR